MSATAVRLKVVNQDTARFECVFPHCGGVCCRNGRPGLEPAEAARITASLAKLIPQLRPEARAELERRGFLTKRVKSGKRTLAVVGGWCVFFNEGCVLHRQGALEGDRWRYKPWHCITFPMDRRADGSWYVRQWGTEAEAWDLFCLDPAESPQRAATTLKDELAFVAELAEGREAWRFRPVDRG